MIGVGRLEAEPPLVTSGPSTTALQKLCAVSLKKPVDASTADTVLLSVMTPLVTLYFFTLPGQW